VNITDTPSPLFLPGDWSRPGNKEVEVFFLVAGPRVWYSSMNAKGIAPHFATQH